MLFSFIQQSMTALGGNFSRVFVMSFLKSFFHTYCGFKFMIFLGLMDLFLLKVSGLRKIFFFVRYINTLLSNLIVCIFSLKNMDINMLICMAVHTTRDCFMSTAISRSFPCGMFSSFLDLIVNAAFKVHHQVNFFHLLHDLIIVWLRLNGLFGIFNIYWIVTFYHFSSVVFVTFSPRF